MSIQRAKINCERCYNIAKEYVGNLRGTYLDDNVYNARNEALKALERVENSGSWTTPALEECLKCDYSSPKICDFLKKDEERYKIDKLIEPR